MFNVIMLSLKEIVSKRILNLGIILTAIYLLVFAIGFHYVVKSYSGGNQAIILQGLAYQFLTFGWYISTFLVGAMAIMLGAGTISREIESGTILTLASRPISRFAINTGKNRGRGLW